MHKYIRTRMVPFLVLTLMLFSSFATAMTVAAEDGDAAADDSPNAAPGVTFQSGSATAPGGGLVTLPSTDTPSPAPPGGYPVHERLPDPPVAVSTTPSTTETPLVAQSNAATEGGETPQAPNDFRVFRNTTLNLTANQTSTTDEPSVAHVGNTVFMTGNWWAAISRDGGSEVHACRSI